jgi:hypothetical protein
MTQSARRVLGTPGRIAAAIVVSLSVSAGLFLPLGPVAYAKPAKGSGGPGTVEEVKAEPTTLAISLQSEGGSGPSITVPDRTRVSASVTLSGANASTARGAVSYAVYSDSACTNEVAWAGPRLIRRSTESPPVRLTPGTYYWQASYSGDAKDLSSVSVCGGAIETVEGSDPPACTTGVGEAHLGTEEGHLVVKNDLSTDLGAEQKLVASWSGGHHLRLTKLLGVACVAGHTASHFHGIGEARVDGKSGYIVRFNIRVSKDGEEALRIHVVNERRERVVDLTGSPLAGSELIS